MLVKCALAAFLGGLAFLVYPELGATWNGFGLLLIGGLCVALINEKYWPRAFSRRPARDAGPEFEVGDPHAPGPSAAPTPLIQAMHRVRGKRPRSSD